MPDPSTSSHHREPIGDPPRPQPTRVGPGKRQGSTGKGHRGRPSQDEYVKQVIPLLRADLFQLHACSAFTQLPGVRAQAKLYSKHLLHEGLAIRILMDQAVDEIRALGHSCGTLLSQRIAIFLEIWYEEAGTVVQAAQKLGLSRSYVVHHVQPKALELVARRFLELAGRVESAA
jgi:hypothetical protein